MEAGIAQAGAIRPDATNNRPMILAIAPTEPFYCFVDGEPLPVFIVRPGHEEEDSDALLAFLRMDHSKANRLFELFITREILKNDALLGDESCQGVGVERE